MSLPLPSPSLTNTTFSDVKKSMHCMIPFFVGVASNHLFKGSTCETPESGGQHPVRACQLCGKSFAV